MHTFAPLITLLVAIYTTGSTAGQLNSATLAINDLPVFYETGDIQLVEKGHEFDSFWASNFVRTTDNRRFLVSANGIVQSGNATRRVGILSLDNPLSIFNRHYQSAVLVSENNGTREPFKLTTRDGLFMMENIPHAGSNFTADAFPSMRIVNSLPGTKFDIDIDMQGAAILNAGLGSFYWAGGIQHQVSLPAARPSGTIVVDNHTLTIDPEHSFTWYDRQWGPTAVEQFAWFGLYLTAPDGSQSTISIWHWQDSVSGDKSFVTTQDRGASENTVIPITAFEFSDERVFRSTRSGQGYSLEYNITLANGKHLHVRSARPDQEYVLDGSKYGFYSGYVEVDGDYSGFGVIDIFGK